MSFSFRSAAVWTPIVFCLTLPGYGQTTLRINAGGQAVTDSAGNQWIADTYFSGGKSSSTTTAIALTNGVPVYQTQRSAKSLTYNLPLPNASYVAVLLFAEIVQGTAIGNRQMDIYLNGTRVYQKLDVTRLAGGTFRAFATQHPVTVSAGTLSVRIDGVTGAAILNGIAITPVITPVTISPVSPATVTLGPGGRQAFTASVTNTTDTGLLWSISPATGSISTTGVYTAPALLSADSVVTVKAASAADPSKAATATVSLKRTSGIGVSISPLTPTLGSDETRQFTAAVTNTSNTAVVWSATAGTISSTGLYKAPAGISTNTSATVKATSVADATRSASTTVTLLPPKVTITPASVTLVPSGTQQFSATVAYSSNKSVVWSINPAVGTISAAGLYTAPATVTSDQTIAVRATSAADPKQYAAASVYLKTPSDATPPTVSFTAPQAGTSNRGTVAVQVAAADNVGVKSVQLLLNGAVLATLSSPYSYAWDTKRAPNGSNTLRAVATDAAGNRTQADVAVNVDNPISIVTMPIEVLGPVGTTREITLDVPSPVTTTDSYRMQLRIHGLDYDNKVAVQINDGVWTILNNTTVTLPTLERAYGGIGGGYHTLRPSFRLPLAALKEGPNKVAFRLETSNGVSSGYRVLAVNFIRPDNSLMVPATSFADEDPNTWLPPSTASADILEGERLWRQATLTSPGFPNGMKAKCSDCHAQDGRDLKYFNYSNNSIRARSVFHGLTEAQGDQIASYIRSLNVPSPGRPWNPPYQPGPGLDSKPVAEWSAGAGLDWVLEKDSDMLPYIFPPSGKPTQLILADANLNGREIPVAMQLPDWNHWLPTIHPMDAFSTFPGSVLEVVYTKTRERLKPNDPSAYLNANSVYLYWVARYLEFRINNGLENFSDVWSDERIHQAYSIQQWNLTKNWELNQEFGLEGMARTVFGPQADDRAWYSHIPFHSSPAVPQVNSVLSRSRMRYLAQVWYNLQLVLNNGNKVSSGTTPIDWPYIHARVAETSSRLSAPQIGLQSLWLVRALQDAAAGSSVAGPSGKGWRPSINLPYMLTDLYWYPIWSDIPVSDRTTIMEGFLASWYEKARTFQPSAIAELEPLSLSVTSPNQNSTRMAERLWFALPRFRFWGVSSVLTSSVADWAATVWPNLDWNSTKVKTCTLVAPEVVCQ